MYDRLVQRTPLRTELVVARYEQDAVAYRDAEERDESDDGGDAHDIRGYPDADYAAHERKGQVYHYHGGERDALELLEQEHEDYEDGEQ